MQKRQSLGFTLIEIMIVVGIVALLVGVIVPVMLRARINANQVSAQAMLKSFATACESYAAANAAIYPSAMDDVITGNAPYFKMDPTLVSRDGYNFAVEFVGNSYTLTATAIANAGNWDYRISTGMITQKTLRTQGDWAAY